MISRRRIFKAVPAVAAAAASIGDGVALKSMAHPVGLLPGQLDAAAFRDANAAQAFSQEEHLNARLARIAEEEETLKRQANGEDTHGELRSEIRNHRNRVIPLHYASLKSISKSARYHMEVDAIIKQSRLSMMERAKEHLADLLKERSFVIRELAKVGLQLY